MELKKQIGTYSLIIGVVIVIVLSLFWQQLGTSVGVILSLLVVLGIIVGFLNVQKKYSRDFLWIVAGLAIIAYTASVQTDLLRNVSLIGPYLKAVFDNTLAFIIPAGIVVGFKEVLAIAKGQIGFEK